MRRSILRLAGICLFVAGSAVAIHKVGVMANQSLTAESALSTLDVLENTDQIASPDCAHLTRLAMQAEVNALSVQFSRQSQPHLLPSTVLELQESVKQLRSFAFENPQVDRLRDQYALLLQQLVQMAKPSDAIHTAPETLDRQVKQVTQFNQDQILFSSCQIS